ncbi:ABC transporter ATP-binding protein [Falsihalocynthiibacter sp. SS001]|uniref:ABC transporter ATP-binding protein n=1 Tax=Falsihalocynthiibacter sp. SS001 TaxID=3349698 RepID=UPI0036D3BADC
MIKLTNLNKTYVLNGRSKIVAKDINLTIPSGATVALMGRNGAGKSTLMEMISGSERPNSGTITSTGTISYPVGFAGSFHKELTGAQNARFVARIYGVDTEEMIDFVEDFAELGDHFHLPVRTYSSGMKSRLAFGVSMGIKFDTYLVDEVTSVGDAAFKDKSAAVFHERMKNSGALVVSHSMSMLKRLCQSGAVLEQGKLYYYDDLNEAIEHYREVIGGENPNKNKKKKKSKKQEQKRRQQLLLRRKLRLAEAAAEKALAEAASK